MTSPYSLTGNSRKGLFKIARLKTRRHSCSGWETPEPSPVTLFETSLWLKTLKTAVHLSASGDATVGRD